MTRLARVGFPVIAVNTTLTLMQVTDAWLMGQLGSEELAALTPPALLLFTLQSAAYGLLSSSTAYVSQCFGQGDAKQCGHLGWQGVYLGVLFGLATLLLWPAAPALFGLFPNASERVLQMEIAYFQICLWAMPAAMVTMAISNFLVGIQRNVVVIASTALTLVTNLGLSVGLVFGWFGFPELGFEGAAYGTVGASLVEAIVMMVIFVGRTRYRRELGTDRWRPSPRLLAGLLRVGVPAAFQVTVDVASWGVLLGWLVAFFGTAHQAATTVLIRCLQVSFLPAEGIAVATLTLVGAEVGAKRWGTANRVVQVGFAMVGSVMTGLGLLLYVCRTEVMGAFTADPEVIAIGVSAMGFVAALQIFDAMGIVYGHALQGTGDTLWPSVVNGLACGATLLLGGLLVVNYWPEGGSQAIWGLMAMYVVVTGLAFRGRWLNGRWRLIELIPTEHAARG